MCSYLHTPSRPIQGRYYPVFSLNYCLTAAVHYKSVDPCVVHTIVPTMVLSVFLIEFLILPPVMAWIFRCCKLKRTETCCFTPAPYLSFKCISFHVTRTPPPYTCAKMKQSLSIAALNFKLESTHSVRRH